MSGVPAPDLLLLSNSTCFGRGYLDHGMEAIRELLGPARRLLFVPFALQDRAAYTARVAARFGDEGIDVEGLAPDPSARTRIAGAAALFVGGGNTFRLLDQLQAYYGLDVSRLRVRISLALGCRMHPVQPRRSSLA